MLLDDRIQEGIASNSIYRSSRLFSLRLSEARIADKGYLLAVRRPRGCVDRALPAVHISDHLGLSTCYGHHAQVHMLVERMVARFYFLLQEGHKHNRLAVR